MAANELAARAVQRVQYAAAPTPGGLYDVGDERLAGKRPTIVISPLLLKFKREEGKLYRHVLVKAVVYADV